MKPRTAAVALAATHLVVAGCRQDHRPDLVEQERLSVLCWTAPPDAVTSPGTGLRRTAQLARVSWEVSVPTTWAQYRSWLATVGDRGYHRSRSRDGALSFSRLSRGDLFIVDIEVLIPDPLELRVTLTAQPD